MKNKTEAANLCECPRRRDLMHQPGCTKWGDLRPEAAKPSPFPCALKVYQPPYSDQFQIRDCDEEIIYAVIPHKGDKANARHTAELFAKGVNRGPAFDAMVEALKMAIDAIEGEWPGLWDQGRAALKLAQEAK